MAATPPKRAVHWDSKELSPSLLGSPLVEGSTESYVSTSSLDYVNAQLTAHGFTSSPGLSLEGLSNSDSERVIKCLLGMLSQRIGDMSRTEGLATNLRTLTYDHERLLTMHRGAVEKAANAEREMNVHKTRLTAALRTLHTTETSHKNTTAELQRTRTSLQTLRATHQSELRRREKDIERMTEKWSKISEAQIKLTTTPAGLRCPNAVIGDGLEVIGKSQNYLEITLDDAEKARAQLTDEVMRLRRLVLKVVNQVQALLHQVRCFSSEQDGEPTPFTLTTLFPMHPPTHAHDVLTTILSSLKDCLTALPEYIASTPSPTTKAPEPDNTEIARLQSVISQLREEVERSQKQTMSQAAETQAMFDQFIADQKKSSENIAEMSVELMTAPMMDQEREKFDRIKRELDEEREKVTQAAITLGKERAALQVERNKLSDERRSWQVQMMLADLPPTPNPPSPHKSPRKSPKKKSSKRLSATTSSGRKATRVSRRFSITPVKTIPAYETEVLPPLPAPSFSNLQSTTSILPSFVLPPPSPYTSLPNKPILLPPLSPPDSDSNPSMTTPDPESNPEPTRIQPIAPASSNLEINPNLTTPVRRPFPVAKPLASKMTHAYSPAKPSPLSRILMLSQSPSIPEDADEDLACIGLGLAAVREEDESDALDGYMAPPASVDSVLETPKPQMSLAAELGVESPPEVPLQERKTETNAGRRIRLSSKKGGADEARKPIVKLKSKSSEPRGTEVSRRPTDGVEKENGATRKANGRSSSAVTLNGTAGRGGTATTSGKSTKPVGSRSTVAAPMTTGPRHKISSKPVPNPTGPRRVPINSAEAPPIVRRS